MRKNSGTSYLEVSIINKYFLLIYAGINDRFNNNLDKLKISVY